MSESVFDTCGPCRSGKHDRCYAPCRCRDCGHPAETLTPSEVALAKVLAAWDAWPGTDGEGEAHEAWLAVALVLGNKGYASGSSLMPVGRALLDRARKAGVL